MPRLSPLPTAATALVAILGLAALGRPAVQAAALSAPLPAPALDEPAQGQGSAGEETAVLSGGCFWGVQGVFEHVRGVRQVLSGYDGGRAEDASYPRVSTGTTGHAESVQIRFDPHVVSYGQILQVFFSVALDPTERDRQGPDTGRQYRSEVFAEGDAQAKIARAYVAQLDAAHAFPRPIATRVDPDGGFFPAEAYHQDYLTHYPDNPYIAVNDLPKVEALRRLFPALYVAAPVLTTPADPAS